MTIDNELSTWLAKPKETLIPVPCDEPFLVEGLSPRALYRDGAPTDVQLLLDGVPVWKLIITGGIFGDRRVNVRIASAAEPEAPLGGWVHLVNLRVGRKPNRPTYEPYFVADSLVTANEDGLEGLLGQK